MSMYWTEEDIRAALQRMHPGGVIGPAESPKLEATPVVEVSEKAFMWAVIRLATARGYKVYHPFDSRKSAPGYPDLTMAKPGRPVIFAELKIGKEKPTFEQQAWLDTLSQAQHPRVFCWRPEDWSTIQEVLSDV